MKKLALILTIFFAANAFAQDAGTSLRSINYNVHLAPEGNTLFMQKKQGEVAVKQQLGFSLGFGLGFKLGKRSTIRTGIGYGLRRYVYSMENPSLADYMGSQTGFIPIRIADQNISFSELHLPLLYQFDFIEDRFFMAAGFELNTAFACTSDLRTTYQNQITTEHHAKLKSTFNAAAVLSLGYKFPLSEKLQMSVEPMAKFYLKQYVVPKSHLINYGLRVSLHF